MPFVPITDTVKVEILGHDTVTNQPWANVLHVTEANAAQTAPNLTEIADATVTAVMAHLGVWSSSAQLDAVRVTGLATIGSPQVTRFFTAGTVGTAASESYPGVAALVKMLTALRTRSGRGRVYLGPIAANEVLDGGGRISLSFQGVVNAFITALQTEYAGVTIPTGLCIASRTLGISHPVTDFACEALSAYQRRRGMR